MSLWSQTPIHCPLFIVCVFLKVSLRTSDSGGLLRVKYPTKQQNHSCFFLTQLSQNSPNHRPGPVPAVKPPSSLRKLRYVFTLSFLTFVSA